ncbi:MAG: hypothetical protein RL390_171 [Actinomycetota bacterium]
MQFNKKNVVAAFTLLFLAACSSGGGNSISGREVPESPIVVVKIDDTNEAHPQVGIDKADLIYIEQVEGGLVRLAALFSSKLPDYIGPVRSARISDIDLLAQFGKVAFFYSGAQSKLYPVIKEANLFDIGAMHESPKIYTRDPDRIAPYDMVLYGPEVKKRIADLDVATTKDFGFTFGDLVKKGRKISSVKLNWPAASYSANWNGKSWDLLHNGKADVTSDGIQISPSTFIIQTVVITDSEYQDKLGGVTPLSITVGEGTGWVLRDGFAIKAKWNRPDASSGTTWSDLDGNEIKMAAGQVWVALTDQAPEFTAPPSKK